MLTVFDVASYILKKSGKMTTMKLQKLIYYSQAWALVWYEKRFNFIHYLSCYHFIRMPE